MAQSPKCPVAIVQVKGRRWSGRGKQSESRASLGCLPQINIDDLALMGVSDRWNVVRYQEDSSRD